MPEYRPVRLVVYDADQLLPLPDPTHACERLISQDLGVLAAATPIANIRVPSLLPEGSHVLEFPEILKQVPEILVLCDVATSRTVFSIKPGSGLIHVYPQNWFNEGDSDFGYQWITRITRDPKTGRLVGDGIRISSFILTNDSTQIDRWISHGV
jgi:hypothetical protein